MNDNRGKKTTSTTPEDAQKAARRDPRVRLELPVFVDSTGPDDQSFHDEAKTIEVSTWGGLIAVPRSFAIGQMLLVVNRKTWERIACQVRSVQEGPSGTTEVGVEFQTRSPRFWGIELSDGEGKDRAEQTIGPESLRDSQTQESLAHGAKANASIPLKIAAKPRTYRKFLLIGSGLLLFGFLGLLALLWITRIYGPPGEARSAVQDLGAEDARLIPGLSGYRLATPNDFSPEGALWLHSFGQESAGKIPGTYSGLERSNAYILIGDFNIRRVVILANGRLRCDGEYNSVAIAARVPKESVQKTEWINPPRVEPEGDGLLIVKDASNPGSGVVLFLAGDRVVPFVPVDFHKVEVN